MKLKLTQAEIRSWAHSDAESLARHANSREIWSNLRDAFPHPYSVEDARSFLATAPATFYAIAVDGDAVGGIGLSMRNDVERFSAELGYWLGPSFWGRGITTEAVLAVTAHGFEELKLERIFALPYGHNRASQRVLEKSGYTCEGYLRKASFKDGQFVDQFLYARLKDDGHPPARHVLTILAVPNLGKASTFYDRAFGWPHSVDTPVYVELSHPDGQRLGLYQREGFAKNTGVMPFETPDDATSATELYFYTRDLEAAARRIESAGASLLSPKALRPWGEEAAYFRDPFGNVIVVARPAG